MALNPDNVDAGLGITGTALNVANSIASWISARKQRQHESYWNRRNIDMQTETNQLMMRENQLNRDFNEAEAQKQRAFEMEMFDRENAYNTPQAQMYRFSQAGLNPALQMQGQGAATASAGGGTSASNNAVPSLQAPRASFMSDMSGIPSQVFGQMLSSLKDLSVLPSIIQRNKAETDERKFNFTDLMPTMNEYYKSLKDKAIGDTNHWKLNTTYQRMMQKFGILAATYEQDSMRQSYDNLIYQGELLQEQKNLVIAEKSLKLLQGKSQEILNTHLDDKQKAEIAQLAALTNLAIEQGAESRENQLKIITDKIYTMAKANGVFISNKIARETAQGVINAVNTANKYQQTLNEESTKYLPENVKYESDLLRIDRRARPWRHASGFINDIVGAIKGGSNSMYGAHKPGIQGQSGQAYYHPHSEHYLP